MAAARSTPETCQGFAARPGVTEMHFAALKDVQSGMAYRNPQVGMGGTASTASTATR